MMVLLLPQVMLFTSLVVVTFIEQGVEATQKEICYNQFQVKMSVLQHNLTTQVLEPHTTCDSILATECCQVS